MTADRVRALVRRAGPGLGLVVLVASLVVATDLFGTRGALFGSATPEPRDAAFSRIDSAPATQTEQTVLISQPWWQTVRRFRGVGTQETPAFGIGDEAIQWRVTWNCERGRFLVRASGRAEPLIDSSCAGETTTELSGTVEGGLQIEADGPWSAQVEQQVDVPLVEPPLPVMTAPDTSEVASGDFYRMDQVGQGRMTIYRLPDDRYALRLSDFYVTPNVDLEIRLSPLREPETTRDYLSAPAKLAAPLPTTTGSMNFALPEDVDLSRYRSVVIWCPIIDSAYAAATLERDQ
ncbi:MAG: DM13 domain-containing protein [Solirubrobacteraceae bacterium MAG38_C4-C5]|nr:DM13 domain-containing protein [Candidatus Siliceabacter maunaloa]